MIDPSEASPETRNSIHDLKLSEDNLAEIIENSASKTFDSENLNEIIASLGTELNANKQILRSTEKTKMAESSDVASDDSKATFR